MGHCHFAQAVAQEFKKGAKQVTGTSSDDLASRLWKLWLNVFAKYNAANTQYDLDTDHGVSDGVYLSGAGQGFSETPEPKADGFTYLFDGCCRGSGARIGFRYGVANLAVCARTCADDATCNAFEVNGCLKDLKVSRIRIHTHIYIVA